MVAIADRHHKTQPDKPPDLFLWVKNVCMSHIFSIAKINASWGTTSRQLIPKIIILPRGLAIAAHGYRYSIKWVKDRLTDRLHIINSRLKSDRSPKFANTLQTYKLKSAVSPILARGRFVFVTLLNDFTKRYLS